MGKLDYLGTQQPLGGKRDILDKNRVPNPGTIDLLGGEMTLKTTVGDQIDPARNAMGGTLKMMNEGVALNRTPQFGRDNEPQVEPSDYSRDRF